MATVVGPTPQGFGVQPLDTTRQQVKRSDIDGKHADWSQFFDAWFNTSLMYEGEPLINKHAEKFLKRRPKEDAPLYQHRMDLFTYENHLGTGLGYYQAQMFDVDPAVHIAPKNPATGAPVTDQKLPTEQDAFYNQRFLKDCDRAGTPLIDQFQKVYEYYLLYGGAWMLDDLPKPDDNNPATNLKEQQDQGLLDPYKVLYSPLDVINWEVDAQGNLNWAVIFVHLENQPFLGKPMVTDRWYYYDRQQYKIYEQTYQKETTEAQNKTCQDDTPCILTDAGYHVMAKYNQVPLQYMPIPSGWWLARRAYSVARAHINVSNTLSWSLQMSALACPVLFTERDVSQLTISEGNFIRLDPNDKYEFAEPEGKSWAELGKREISLKESIFRSMFLVSMARDTNSTAAAQSGVSKQQDMAPSHVVLSGMGAALRSAMQEALTRTMKVRAALTGLEGDLNLTADVRGFEFEDKLTVEELDVIQTMLDMGVPSDLFEKQVFIQAARVFLKNGNADMLQSIIDQINASPTKEERDQAQMEMRQQSLRKQITGRMADPVLKESSD